MKSYVHALSAERDALLEFVEDAESSFLEFGIAPEIDRPTAVPIDDANDYARMSPTDEQAQGWLPYLTPAAIEAVTGEGTTTVHYAGVAGMAATARVLRETTGTHPDVVLQTHTYATAPSEYAVHRYDRDAGQFTCLATGDYS